MESRNPLNIMRHLVSGMCHPYQNEPESHWYPDLPSKQKEILLDYFKSITRVFNPADIGPK